MVPQEELERALARWRARVHGHGHGHGQQPAVVEETPVAAARPSVTAVKYEDVTQVVHSPYQGGESGNVVAEVNLDDGDLEDYGHESVH